MRNRIYWGANAPVGVRGASPPNSDIPLAPSTKASDDGRVFRFTISSDSVDATLIVAVQTGAATRSA